MKEPMKNALLKSSYKGAENLPRDGLLFKPNSEMAFKLASFFLKKKFLEPDEFLHWFRDGKIPEIAARYFKGEVSGAMEDFWSPSKGGFTNVISSHDFSPFFSVLKTDHWTKLDYRIISLFYEDPEHLTDAIAPIVESFRSKEFFEGLSSGNKLVKNITETNISLLEHSEDNFGVLEFDDVIKSSRFIIHSLNYIRTHVNPEVLGEGLYSSLKDGVVGRKLDTLELLCQVVQLNQKQTKGAAGLDMNKLDLLPVIRDVPISNMFHTFAGRETAIKVVEGSIKEKSVELDKLFEKGPKEFSDEIRDWLNLPNQKKLLAHRKPTGGSQEAYL